MSVPVAVVDADAVAPGSSSSLARPSYRLHEHS